MVRLADYLGRGLMFLAALCLVGGIIYGWPVWLVLGVIAGCILLGGVLAAYVVTRDA